MSREIVPYVTEQEWLEARTHDITSTESAALFDASPYTTPYELFHAKAGKFVEIRNDNPRMRWGRRLQEPIAFGVAEDLGLDVEPMREYMRESEARVGASFDYRITGARGRGPKTTYASNLLTRGPGLMEIKTVDQFAYRESWVITEGEAVEAPAHIELQVQHQMLVSGLQWALIVALIGGNRVSVIERGYDAEIGAAILRAAVEFWKLVDQGTPPMPDYTRDAATIARRYVESTAGSVLDCREDQQLFAWASRYRQVGDEARMLGKERDELKARILERVGPAAKVLLPDYASLACGTVRETVVPEHTRAPYRNLRLYTKKEPRA